MLPFQGANGILFINAGRCPALGYSAPSGRFGSRFLIRDSHYSTKKFPFRNQNHERGIFKSINSPLQNLFFHKMLGNSALVGFNADEINALR